MNRADSSQEILRHLERFGVRDKDAARAAASRKRATRQQVRTVSGFDATVDLHGMTQDVAAPAFRTALQRCKDNGMRTLLVIHGQGLHSNPVDGAVLKTMVRQMLDNELEGSIRDYRAAAFKDGGEGATVVRIR